MVIINVYKLLPQQTIIQLTYCYILLTMKHSCQGHHLWYKMICFQSMGLILCHSSQILQLGMIHLPVFSVNSEFSN